MQAKLGNDKDDEGDFYNKGEFKNAEECAHTVYQDHPNAKGSMFHKTRKDSGVCFYTTSKTEMNMHGDWTSYYSCLYRGKCLMKKTHFSKT